MRSSRAGTRCTGCSFTFTTRRALLKISVARACALNTQSSIAALEIFLHSLLRMAHAGCGCELRACKLTFGAGEHADGGRPAPLNFRQAVTSLMKLVLQRRPYLPLSRSL